MGGLLANLADLLAKAVCQEGAHLVAQAGAAPQAQRLALLPWPRQQATKRLQPEWDGGEDCSCQICDLSALELEKAQHAASSSRSSSSQDAPTAATAAPRLLVEGSCGQRARWFGHRWERRECRA